MRAAQAKMRQAATLAEETNVAIEFAAAASAQSDLYKAAAEAEAAKAEAALLKSRTMPKATEVESLLSNSSYSAAVPLQKIPAGSGRGTCGADPVPHFAVGHRGGVSSSCFAALHCGTTAITHRSSKIHNDKPERRLHQRLEALNSPQTLQKEGAGAAQGAVPIRALRCGVNILYTPCNELCNHCSLQEKVEVLRKELTAMRTAVRDKSRIVASLSAYAPSVLSHPLNPKPCTLNPLRVRTSAFTGPCRQRPVRANAVFVSASSVLA